ncbi:MAG: type I pullulanase [Planctomycetota bacterium]
MNRSGVLGLRDRASGWLFAMLAALPLLVSGGCSSDGASRTVTVAEAVEPEALGAGSVLVLHYHRADGNYEDWNAWVWVEGQQGAGYPFEGRDEYGAYAVVPIEQRVARIGFVPRKGEWEDRDGDRDRYAEVNTRGVAEAWIVAGNPNAYTERAEVDMSMRIVNAFLDARDTVTLATSAQLNDAQLYGLTVSAKRDHGATYRVTASHFDDAASSHNSVYRLRIEPPVADDHVASLLLSVPGENPEVVYARDVLLDDVFTPLEADLGPEYSSERTVFNTWSPVSESVTLLIYEDAGSRRASREVALEPGEKGLWSASVEGDLHGIEYSYRFVSYGQTREVPDIHCFAATADSSRSIVVDLDRLDPEGWGGVPTPKLAQQTDEIIYEIHVRDYSVRDETVPEEQRGTYLGLIHENPAGHVSGIDHLLDLGVTAVHLLPIHDYPNTEDEYNWGYWTTLFNVPESNYAVEFSDTLSAITELKTAIQGLHSEGIRVILDVVYNHTSSSFEASPFDQTVPWYYFRTEADGRLRNDAGVGNSVADERPMVREYILDSLEYWVREYRVDGFRFDLLGTHHPETVDAICERVLSIRDDLTLYGEPWTGGGPIYFSKGEQRGTRMAVFNDHHRNAIRGDLDGTTRGFANGVGGNIPAVRDGVAGGIDDFADHPSETITYVSAHDNLTLWDKLLLTRPDLEDDELRAMQKLSLGIVLTSQGASFIHGGSDFARTKGGNHNSYNAGDEVNKFDWARKTEYRDVYDYTKGLIAIRRAQPAFRLATREQVREHIRFQDDAPDGVVAFELAAVPGGWSRILVAYNGEDGARSIDLPDGAWSVAADHETAGVSELGIASVAYELPAYSMVVLYQD